jgi:hypothetical protein
MDRFIVTSAIFFLSFFTVTCGASVIVTNDWASAKLQVRDGVGGPIVQAVTVEEAANFNFISSAQIQLDQTSYAHGWASAYIDSAGNNGGNLVDSQVSTDDLSPFAEAEGWLFTSWSFKVVGASTDYSILLGVDEGGDFTSGYSLYDLTDDMMVNSNSLYSLGSINNYGTLLLGHEYLFNSKLCRIDSSKLQDNVGDGTTSLAFRVDTDVQFSLNRTHQKIGVSEPGIGLIFIAGFMALMGIRGCRRLTFSA